MLKPAEPHVIFKHSPTADLLKQYFEVLDSDQPLYICVIGSGEGSSVPKVYVEKNKNPNAQSTIRLFFRKTDVDAYMSAVALQEKLHVESIRYWATHLTEALPVLMKMNNRNIENGGVGYNFEATIIDQAKIIKVDTLWSTDTANMV